MIETNPLGYEKIGKLILRFSAPAIASNLLNAVYNIVDQIFIGHGIGYDGIAATNIAFPLVTITTAVSILIGVGCAANFSLNLGAGNKEKAARFAGNGLAIMLLCGVCISLISILFLSPLLRLFGANDEIMGLATDYTFIVSLGIPFQVVTLGLSNLIRADGSPNRAMLSMTSGAVFNLIFDPIFMFTFGWGIKGIAWATTLGQVLSASIALVYYFCGMKTVRLSKTDFLPDIARVKAICVLGTAGFVNQIALTLMTIVLNNTLKYYGEMSKYGSTITLGAVGATTKINIIFLACCVGLGQGCQPINGFNYGAGNYVRVKRTLQLSLIGAIIISAAFFLAFQLLPREILAIFGEGSAEYFEFGTRYLRIFMFMTFANWAQPMVAGYFTSTGRASLGVMISITRQILFLIPLLIILPLKYGIDGVVFAGPIADSAAAALGVVFFIREFRRLNRLIRDV